MSARRWCRGVAEAKQARTQAACYLCYYCTTTTKIQEESFGFFCFHGSKSILNSLSHTFLNSPPLHTNSLMLMVRARAAFRWPGGRYGGA